MELLELWEKTKLYISTHIGPVAYEAWFGKVVAVEKNASTICLKVPNEFSRDWITKHYLSQLKESLEKDAQKEIHVDFEITLAQKTAPEEAVLKQPLTEGARLERISAPLNLNPRLTFENFVVGPANRFAHAAALAVSDAPAKAYNPLFIYGGVGLGKTHLMQAICHELFKKRGPGFKICYLPSEKFTNELIDAIQHHSTSKFRAKFRSADLLVIDDVHFIGGKEATQEEFFNTFNALYDAHKQIIISSDRVPKEIPKLEERLISRFSWGLVTDIQPPDYETRVAILKKKMEHEPILVPDDVIFYIAKMVKTNIRELEGAMIRVAAFSSLENKPITLGLAQGALKDFLKESIKTITVELIQKEVSSFFNLTPTDLKEDKRNRNIVTARQIAMYLTRELTNFSLPEIGRFFGGKDHTTVLHSYNKIKETLKKDKEFKILVENIIHNLQQ